MVITTDPAVEVALELLGRPRDEAIQVLLESVDYRREPLERARDALIHRLDLRSDDFEATEGLRLVYEALARVGWPGQPIESARPNSRGRGYGHRRGGHRR